MNTLISNIYFRKLRDQGAFSKKFEGNYTNLETQESSPIIKKNNKKYNKIQTSEKDLNLYVENDNIYLKVKNERKTFTFPEKDSNLLAQIYKYNQIQKTDEGLNLYVKNDYVYVQVEIPQTKKRFKFSKEASQVLSKLYK